MRKVTLVLLMLLALVATAYAGNITEKYQKQLVRSAASQQLGGSQKGWSVKIAPSTVPKWNRYTATSKTRRVMTGAIFIGKGENAIIRGRTRVIRDAAPVTGNQFLRKK